MTSNVMLNAKRNRNDEFYTQFEDIAKELKHYKPHFKDKVVYCNCDDPYESNFFKYFALRFNHLGLKKLITTSFANSPIMRNLFMLPEHANDVEPEKIPYAIEVNEVKDLNNDGAVDLFDVDLLLKNDRNASHKLSGDGSFDSQECLEFLKEADIICTNPPFSLFRDYFTMLMSHKKHFLILGNMSACAYNEIRPSIMESKLWLGCNNGSMKFIVPGETELKSLGFVRWFTNLSHNKRNEELILFKKYSPNKYPKYDNYDAIEVEEVKNIPKDYDGEMGVPLSFLEKWNPDQFELVGFDDDMPKSNGKYGHQRFGVDGKHKFARVVIKIKQ